jgi:hypothetical protein
LSTRIQESSLSAALRINSFSSQSPSGKSSSNRLKVFFQSP